MMTISLSQDLFSNTILLPPYPKSFSTRTEEALKRIVERYSSACISLKCKFCFFSRIMHQVRPLQYREVVS
jgi:hypothetical protein